MHRTHARARERENGMEKEHALTSKPWSGVTLASHDGGWGKSPISAEVPTWPRARRQNERVMSETIPYHEWVLLRAGKGIGLVKIRKLIQGNRKGRGCWFTYICKLSSLTSRWRRIASSSSQASGSP